jgi:DHA1 family tetracycline resistance protein-like MFS transporter
MIKNIPHESLCMSKQKFIIILIVFLDVLGIGLVIPILPIYVENMTNSAFLATAIFSIYSFCGFFAAPLLGGLSDRYGRRPILILSLLGTSLGWFLLAIGNNIWFLMIGRIIDGITSGNIATAQSYLIDVSKDAKERTTNLGLIGATFGIGFIIGPALGALLASISIPLAFWSAGGLALLNTIAAYFFLPETNLHKDPSRPLTMNPFRGIKKVFINSNLTVLFLIWFLYTMSFSSMQTMFSLFTHLAFNLSATANGWLFTIMGLIIAFNQGFLLKNFWLKKFSEAHLELAAVLAALISYLLIITNIFWLFILALILLSFSQALLRVINNSEISGAAPVHERGQMVGVIQSVMFLSSILAPLIGGFGLSLYVNVPWWICFFYMGIAFILLQIKHKRIEKMPILNESIPQEDIVEI